MANSSPPSAGPPMTETWNATDRTASARGRMSSGTSDGVSAREAGAPTAVATPVKKASAKNGHVWSTSYLVTARSPQNTAASRAIASTSTVRRGNRSARCPAGRASSGSGMNIARPTSPRSSGLPLMA